MIKNVILLVLFHASSVKKAHQLIAYLAIRVILLIVLLVSQIPLLIPISALSIMLIINLNVLYAPIHSPIVMLAQRQI